MLVLLLWLGCGEKDTGVDNPLILDVDGDGYFSDVDCDDDNSAVYPEAIEVCDGFDNDCDALIDSADDSLEADAWFADSDSDGFGAGTPTLSCEAPEGFVDNAADCDDESAELNPNGLEECDGLDNDCNGTVDDLPSDFEDPFFALYLDNDGDGFGDESTLFYACDVSPGVVDVADDCNDSNMDVYPDAAEACDEIDNDCDGIIDEQEDGFAQCDECTDEVLPSVTGALSNTVLTGDDVQASCSQVGAADRVFRWIAPATGTFFFWSGVESLAVWKDCGTEELACGISGIAPANATVDVVEGDVLQLVLEGAEGSVSDLEIWAIEELVCDDGNDDDQDGLIDCDDESDCWFDASCAATQCPNFSLVDTIDYVTPLNGDSITTQSLGDFTDTQEASCFTGGASDVTFSYEAVSNGCAQLFAASNDVDVQLAVFDSCGGTEIECNAGSTAATTRFGTTYGAYVPLQLTTGEEYTIVISGQSVTADTVTLHIDRNDEVDCAGTAVE